MINTESVFGGIKGTHIRLRLWIIITDRLKRCSEMSKNRVFAVHPGEILKEEFMRPMQISAYQLAKALRFPGIYDVVRGDRSISADTAIRLARYFGLPAQFWLNLQNDYDLRLAERSGAGTGIKPRASNATSHEVANL
jgi:addiction module HigA family antidote